MQGALTWLEPTRSNCTCDPAKLLVYLQVEPATMNCWFLLAGDHTVTSRFLPDQCYGRCMGLGSQIDAFLKAGGEVNVRAESSCLRLSNSVTGIITGFAGLG